MASLDQGPAAAGLRTMLELADAGVQMMREHLRREHPDASESELDALVNAWITSLHAKEFQDGAFRAVAWPRGSE